MTTPNFFGRGVCMREAGACSTNFLGQHIRIQNLGTVRQYLLPYKNGRNNILKC